MKSQFAFRAASQPILAKNVLLGVCVAVFLSSNSVTVLCYGLVGISGNSIFTGGLTVTTLTLIFCLGEKSDWRYSELFFLGLIGCFIASSLLNETRPDNREIALFAFSLAAYPCFRRVSFAAPAVRETFVCTIGVIVALGTTATAYAIITQWDVMRIRPVVLGFSDGPATYFLMSCGFLIIAVTTADLNWRKTWLLSAFIFGPVLVYAASQVRMAFIAMVGALLIAAFLSEARQRKYYAIIITVMLAAIAIGTTSRYSTTHTMLKYVVEAPKEVQAQRTSTQVQIARLPSCSLEVNPENSIAIRRALLRDALYLMPQAGAFGFGLGSFAKISCVSMEVHNSFLQTFVEFGWIGGICFCGTFLFPVARLLRSKIDHESKFALCALAYMALISLAHGRLIEDRALFAMLGLAAGVFNHHQRLLLGQDSAEG
jgi:O-antigen ligase